MKITSMGTLTSFALIMVIIAFPLFFQNDNRVKTQRIAQETMLHYDGAIHAAVQDAAFSLKLNEAQDFEAKYDSLKYVRSNKERAVEAFFRTLHVNFGIQNDEVAQGVLQGYIPVLAVIDYDGFWIYADEAFHDSSGQNVYRQVWKAKKPFAYADGSGNSLSFTLDDYVFAYDRVSQTWHQGHRADVAAAVQSRIPLLNNPASFEQVRRSAIVNAIQSDLQHYINAHNQFAKRLGISYTFTLPTISLEEWNNSINDIGFMAFVQGLPLGSQTYNSYALGGGRLIKKPQIYGVIRNGIRYAYRSTCPYSDPIQEIFADEKSAARQGYRTLSCANP